MINAGSEWTKVYQKPAHHGKGTGIDRGGKIVSGIANPDTQQIANLCYKGSGMMNDKLRITAGDALKSKCPEPDMTAIDVRRLNSNAQREANMKARNEKIRSEVAFYREKGLLAYEAIDEVAGQNFLSVTTVRDIVYDKRRK